MRATDPDGSDSVSCRCWGFCCFFVFLFKLKKRLVPRRLLPCPKSEFAISWKLENTVTHRVSGSWPSSCNKTWKKKKENHCLGQDGALMWRIIRLENFVISHHCAVWHRHATDEWCPSCLSIAEPLSEAALHLSVFLFYAYMHAYINMAVSCIPTGGPCRGIFFWVEASCSRRSRRLPSGEWRCLRGEKWGEQSWRFMAQREID